MSLAFGGITAYTGTGTSSSVVSGRLSFTFGLQGPAMTIDTACSSSLVGLHMAYNCLDMGQCETASSSGANIILHPTTLATLQKAGMLTYDGRCKTLNATADGYVRAEAIGSILLYSGDIKISDCSGFICGSFVNQDGRSSALTAPNGPAQSTVIQSAMGLAGMSYEEISALQMHGTGTALGDPIEIGAANTSLSGSARTKPLALMSSKSWMGHAEPAAGLAGLVHAQTATGADLSLPMLHLVHMNPYVSAVFDSAEQAVSIPRQSAGTNLSVIGTSAFAFQGTNAHVILSSTDRYASKSKPKLVGDKRNLMLQKKHLWLVPSVFRFLQRTTCRRKATILSVDLRASQNSYLWDHMVQGRHIFPGAGYFEMSNSAARLLTGESSTIALLDSSIPSALVMNPAEKVQSELIISINPHSGILEIGSSINNVLPKPHFLGQVGIALSKIEETDTTSASRHIFLTAHHHHHQQQDALYFADIADPVHDESTYVISPSSMDCTLQLGAIGGKPGDPLFIPAASESMVLPRKSARSLHAVALPVLKSAERTLVDILMQLDGDIGGSIKHLVGKSIGKTRGTRRTSASGASEAMYEQSWLADQVLPGEALESKDFSLKVTGNDHSIAIASGLSAAVALSASKAVTLTTLTPNVSTEIHRMTDQVVRQAGLQGMMRSMAQEFSDISFASVGYAVEASQSLNPTLRASGSKLGNNQYPISIQNRTVLSQTLEESYVRPSKTAYQLLPQPRGALNNLRPEALDISTVRDGEIVIDVKSVGINFRDVLNVLGMYPGDPGPPGGDCSGVVVSCGQGVDSLQPGDAVFGLAGGSLGSHVHVSAPRMAPMPPNLSFEAAATCPTVFITVDAAFRQAAGCQPGERALVHGAAGGVGLAAIQQVAALGGVVVATAGGPNKRSLVRGMGVCHAFGSRDTQFVSEVAELGGGRFIEISKRDIWSGSRVCQERPDVGYTLVAVDFLPDMAVNRYLTRLAWNLSVGSLKPLPSVNHSLDSVRSALRQMSQARHIGKIVTRRARLSDSHGLSGFWFVTGGLGMIGSLVGTWMSSNNVEHIVLLSRTGRGDNAAVRSITNNGTTSEVSACKCDITSSENVAGIVSLFSSSKPVMGLIHSGGVLSDAMAINQNLSRVRTVSGPKSSSALIWKNSVRNYPLSNAVLFSSVASLLGSPGQTNYSAANATIDVIADLQLNHGSPALSIQWGAWAEGGMANEKTRLAVERLGMGMVKPNQGISAFSSLMFGAMTKSVISVVPFIWENFLRQFREIPPMFGNFAEFWSPGALPSSSTHDVIQRPKERKPKARKGFKAITNSSCVDFELQVQEAVKAVLGKPVDSEEPLMAAGLDSLGTVELKNALESSFGISLPSTLVFDYPTVGALSKYLETTASLHGGKQQELSSDDESVEENQSKVDRRRRRKSVKSTPRPRIGDFEPQVQEAVKAVLGKPVDSEEPLMAAGLDSLGTVELKNALESSFGISLPSTLVFDYPTVGALSNYLSTQISSDFSESGDDLSLADVEHALIPSGGARDVQILCFSSKTHRDFITEEPSDCVEHVPLSRWDLEKQVDLCGGLPVPFGVFLDHVDMFDNSLFGLSETESVLIDPQQRLLLETAFDIATQRSLEMSEEQNRANWGVFVGVSSNDYAKISSKHLKGVTAYSATGDQSLYAFNSGVNLTLAPETPAMFQRAGMTTLNGRCKTLDASADGYVRGEAVVTCLLSSDHQESVGLIKGTAVNQAGRSATLTAPNGPSQQEVLRNALTVHRKSLVQCQTFKCMGQAHLLEIRLRLEPYQQFLLMGYEERIQSLCLLPNRGLGTENLLRE
eukprot:jgi/Picre1/29100/NNA_004493.t1